jgi:protein TonB
LNVPGYAVKSLTYGTTDLLHDPIKLSSADTDEIHVALTASTLTVITPNLINVGQGVGVVGGVVGGVPGGIVLGPPPPPPPPPAPPLSGSVPPQIITKVEPSYNDAARAARVQGEVVLSVIVTADGGVDGITVVSGDALLRQPAIDAVKQWRFRPGTVNGQPVAVRLSVTVNFRLY